MKLLKNLGKKVENNKGDEEAEVYDEDSLRDSISSFSEKEEIEENENIDFDD